MRGYDRESGPARKREVNGGVAARRRHLGAVRPGGGVLVEDATFAWPWHRGVRDSSLSLAVCAETESVRRTRAGAGEIYCIGLCEYVDTYRARCLWWHCSGVLAATLDQAPNGRADCRVLSTLMLKWLIKKGLMFFEV